MMDMDIFQLLYNHLEERHYNNICQNASKRSIVSTFKISIHLS